LVEQRIRNAKVGSSTLLTGTMNTTGTLGLNAGGPRFVSLRTAGVVQPAAAGTVSSSA
jgi:hypothetical protein